MFDLYSKQSNLKKKSFECMNNNLSIKRLGQVNNEEFAFK